MYLTAAQVIPQRASHTAAHNIDPSAIAEIFFSMIPPSLTGFAWCLLRSSLLANTYPSSSILYSHLFPKESSCDPFSLEESSMISCLLTTLSIRCYSSHLPFLLLVSVKPGNCGKNVARVKESTKVNSRPLYSTS